MLAALAGFGQQNAQANPVPVAPPALSFSQSVIPPPPPGFVPPPPPVAANVQPAGLPAPSGGVNELAGQILQAMAAGTIPTDQGFQVLNALAAAQNSSVPALPLQAPVATQAQPATQNGQQDRFEQNDNRQIRDRSRSPDFNRRRRSPARRSPPNRRDSPTYGVYDPNAGAEGNSSSRHERGDKGRGRGRNRSGRNDRNEYRQRTPPRRQPSPAANAHRNNGASKFIEWDHTMPRDNIKVFSRTLFIGGASGSEAEIRNIFSRFGKVQTCIVNQDKRHAFVKMLTRPDAVRAKEGMDNIQDPAALSKARQVRKLFVIVIRHFLTCTDSLGGRLRS